MKGEVIKGSGQRPLQMQVRRRGCTAGQRKAFLEVLAGSSNVKLAARTTGIHLSTVYRLRARDRAFARLWEEAIAIGYDRLEQALLERARLGVNDIEIDGDMPLVIGESEDELKRSPRIVDGRIEMNVKLAQWLLDRHERTVCGGEGPRGMKTAIPTREAIEAKILKKVEALKKQGRFDR